MQTACVIQVTDENGAPVCELPSSAPRQRVPSPPPNHHANFLLQTSNLPSALSPMNLPGKTSSRPYGLPPQNQPAATECSK
ncbi:hypothetical protein WR25_16431 [Diploscapter pachys]|uniref:Uncharacterized protein n=1 Tax=Diploscapter pachys TaxID=2018661 RepID=A0A2A2JVR6_9BILA|nr:hypothetical protein WR25_16431 [Diploscapter pachys]